jgi:hypothetical protein
MFQYALDFVGLQGIVAIALHKAEMSNTDQRSEQY